MSGSWTIYWPEDGSTEVFRGVLTSTQLNALRTAGATVSYQEDPSGVVVPDPSAGSYQPKYSIDDVEVTPTEPSKVGGSSSGISLDEWLAKNAEGKEVKIVLHVGK